MNSIDKTKILIVDDSKLWRDFIISIIKESKEHDFEIIGNVENGLEALKILKTTHADIVLLDIEMDIMDGMTALPKMIDFNPYLKIIMISNLTAPYAKITLEALSIGAADFIPKPSISVRTYQNKSFHDELIDKLKYYSDKSMRKKIFITPVKKNNFCSLKVLAIGASTGGPRFIVDYLSELSKSFSYPVLVAQHMPPVFTKAFAEVIHEKTGRYCVEAEDGMEINSNMIFVAKGDYHLELKKTHGKVFISLNQKEPVNFCRPSVDVLFESVAEVYSNEALAIVFSGMGKDGMEGAKKLAKKGAKIFVQDEESSTVWGMPGAIAEAGIASKILSVKELAKETEKVFNLL